MRTLNIYKFEELCAEAQTMAKICMSERDEDAGCDFDWDLYEFDEDGGVVTYDNYFVPTFEIFGLGVENG